MSGCRHRTPRCTGGGAVLCVMRGASLLVALVVLVMMSLGALAMVRSVSTGLLLAGNFTFRQAAVLASERGSEAAISWLSTRVDSAEVLVDQPDAGYYASYLSGLDLTGNASHPVAVVDWLDDGCRAHSGSVCIQPSPTLSVDFAGHTVRYLIQRLCRADGSPDVASNSCLRHRSGLRGSPNHGQLSYGASKHFHPTHAVYYRITIHTRGPRGTTAFTQILVHY